MKQQPTFEERKTAGPLLVLLSFATTRMLEQTYQYTFNTMEVEWDNLLFTSISGIPNNFASHCSLGGLFFDLSKPSRSKTERNL
jgi:hypothetical protein